MNDTVEDNYSSEKRLAGQIESEWGDILLGDFLEPAMPAARRLGYSTYVVGPTYYEAVAGWTASLLMERATVRRVADIGAGLGRFLYELIGRVSAIERATYVEPSSVLFSWATHILQAQPAVPRVPFLKGVGQVGWHDRNNGASLDIERLRKINFAHGSVDAVEEAAFDLVVALNVLDQCARPSTFARQIMARAAVNGYVAFSCAHQFQERFYIDRRTVFENLHDLFPRDEWRFVAETELPYVFRTGERHRNWFLSHHVLYERIAVT